MGKLFYTLMGIALAVCSARADSIRVGNVLYRDVYIREGKDFYFVYHPEAGRMERVSKHRSNVSEVVMSEDTAYREGLMAQFRARQGGAPAEAAPTKASKSVVPADSVQTLNGDLVKFRAQMKDLALFEAQLAHWQTLPEDVRKDIHAGLYETLAQRTARRAADRVNALVQLDELGGTKAVVEQELASAAAERAAAVERAQAEDESDFYLRAYENSKGYVRTDHLYYDECENLRSIPMWWYTEDPSLYDAALAERSWTADKIGAAEQTFAHQASVYGSELNKVERAMTQQERAAKAAVAKSQDEQRRYGDRQMRAAALADATEAGYRARLSPLPIDAWEGVSAGRMPEFTVGEGIWRLDCRVGGGGSEEGFAVTIFDADTDQPFTRIAGGDFLGMRTRIFDEPGRYYVVVEQGLAAVPYEIEVSALELR
jgi:hypothetical protein